jgi:3-oxoacyl-[acyl-carrier-protein] synthase-1
VTTPLTVAATGAVTPVGLNAAQSCAAIRARITGFSEVMVVPPPLDPVIAAKVPAPRRAKDSPFDWLANLATRAIRECLHGSDVPLRTTAVLMALPDRYREHAALTRGPHALMHAVETRLRGSFHSSSVAIPEGHAGAVHAIGLARSLLDTDTVSHCLVGGVDSLVNAADVQRLSAAGRLHEAGNPQGLIPGEGAAFLLLARGRASRSSLAQVVGAGSAMEADTANGERYAVGRGLRGALTAAVREAACVESRIGLRVSDMNGERYYAWDSMIAFTQFYRTRRDSLPVWYPASSIGDTGAAAGAMSMIVAVNAINRGFAPGGLVMCESSSDEGLRAACLVAAMPGSHQPPFVAGEDD